MPDRRLVLSTLVRAATAAAAAGPLGAAPALAQDAAAGYPSKPVRIVVGFPPGGPTDIVARALAQKMQEGWSQPVTVDNRPGATSNIAAEHVARAEPDGHTLLLGTIANATNMALYRNLKYDTLRDFAPVSHLTASPSVLVVSPALSHGGRPVADLKALVALAKERPGTLTYASTGAGGSPHLAAVMLEQRTGVRLVHVPYKGSAPGLNDMVGGQVDMGFVTALSAIPLMQAGKLRPIGVAASRRLAVIPAVPTMAELGLPDFEVSSWNGLLAPAKTPPAVVAKLHAEMVRILALRDVRDRLAEQAAEPIGSSPEAFRAYIESEIRLWGEMVRKAGVTAE